MVIQQKSAQTRSCYGQLRRQLMHGQLTSGSRLVEEKWAGLLGVNRSALREALTILAHEGFLEVGPRGGFFVPESDQRTLDEILEVRVALEIGALQILEIDGAVPQEGLERLREACDLMEQLMRVGFEYGFAEADRRFHEILVEMAGNARLLRVYRQAPLLLSPMPEPDEESRQENMRKTLADHRELLRLLEEGRIGETQTFLRRHLLVDHRVAARKSESGRSSADAADSADQRSEERKKVPSQSEGLALASDGAVRREAVHREADNGDGVP